MELSFRQARSMANVECSWEDACTLPTTKQSHSKKKGENNRQGNTLSRCSSARGKPCRKASLPCRTVGQLHSNVHWDPHHRFPGSEQDLRSRKTWHQRQADLSGLVVRTRKTLQWMPAEADYQRPSGSPDISADAGRERWCLGTRWTDVLFSRCQAGQMKSQA